MKSHIMDAHLIALPLQAGSAVRLERMSIGGEMRLGRMSSQALERFAAAGKLEELSLEVSWCISLMQDIGKKILAKEASLFDELACIES